MSWRRRFERRRIEPPKAPAIEPVRSRKEAREAERAALEAEIQSLVLPGDVERAMKAGEAKRNARERQDAAINADQVAREPARKGLYFRPPGRANTRSRFESHPTGRAMCGRSDRD
jgi:hypothetical protein